MIHAALLLASVTAVRAADVPKPSTRPNILLIISEDMGQELGCYGDRYVRTPNLDRLAASGVRFLNAYITQAGCSQSRSSILTGLYPHQNGQIGLATWGFRMYREDTPNIPRSLKAAGYRTGRIGKLHVNPESAFPYDMEEIPSGNFATKNLLHDEVNPDSEKIDKEFPFVAAAVAAPPESNFLQCWNQLRRCVHSSW